MWYWALARHNNRRILDAAKTKRENGAEGQKRQGELRMGHFQILGHIAVMLYRAFAIHKETAGGKSVIIILVVIMPALSFSERGH